MGTNPKILVLHTAFIGDIILTTSMIASLREKIPNALVDVVTTPSGVSVLQNNPNINSIIEYDKRGRDSGIFGLFSLVNALRRTNYDVAIIPHRSIRSALIGYSSKISRRIGFSTSSGSFLFSDVVVYRKDAHEIERNLDLLKPLKIENHKRILPSVYPSKSDTVIVEELLGEHRSIARHNMVAIAPGTVWNTKRWLPERFTQLANLLLNDGRSILLIGGKEDTSLCNDIEQTVGDARLLNLAGKLTLLQSAEAIRRSRVLVCNDSAPMHLGVAMRTPVIAIYGATIPEFGFAPIGERDRVIQTMDLACRPCGIHGGKVCPIGTFECMTEIEAAQVVAAVNAILTPVESAAM